MISGQIEHLDKYKCIYAYMNIFESGTNWWKAESKNITISTYIKIMVFLQVKSDKTTKENAFVKTDKFT